MGTYDMRAGSEFREPSPFQLREMSRASRRFIECLFEQTDAGADPEMVFGGLTMALGEIMRRDMSPAEAAAMLRKNADDIETLGWAQGGEMTLA